MSIKKLRKILEELERINQEHIDSCNRFWNDQIETIKKHDKERGTKHLEEMLNMSEEEREEYTRSSIALPYKILPLVLEFCREIIAMLEIKD